MRDVLFEFLAYRSPQRHDQSLMDGARKVRNLFYLLTPAEPGLGDGYWESLIGAWRELRSCDLLSILSRPLPHDKAGVVTKQTSSFSSNSLKMSHSFLDLRPFEHQVFLPPIQTWMPFLAHQMQLCLCCDGIWSILSMVLSSPLTLSLPQLPEQCVPSALWLSHSPLSPPSLSDSL